MMQSWSVDSGRPTRVPVWRKPKESCTVATAVRRRLASRCHFVAGFLFVVFFRENPLIPSMPMHDWAFV